MDILNTSLKLSRLLTANSDANNALETFRCQCACDCILLTLSGSQDTWYRYLRQATVLIVTAAEWNASAK